MNGIQKPGFGQSRYSRLDDLSTQWQRTRDAFKPHEYFSEKRVASLKGDVIDFTKDVIVATSIPVATPELYVIAAVRASLNLTSSLLFPEGAMEATHSATALLSPAGMVAGLVGGLTIGNEGVFSSARAANAVIGLAGALRAPAGSTLGLLDASDNLQQLQQSAQEIADAFNKGQSQSKKEQEKRSQDQIESDRTWKDWKAEPSRPMDDRREIPKPGSVGEIIIA